MLSMGQVMRNRGTIIIQLNSMRFPPVKQAMKHHHSEVVKVKRFMTIKNNDSDNRVRMWCVNNTFICKWLLQYNVFLKYFFMFAAI